jgi:predicted permease
MTRLRVFLLRVRGLFDAHRRDRELAEEIESNIQLHVEDHVRAGLPYDEARRQALLKFGSVAGTRERYRDRVGLPPIDSLLQDLRYAARTLRKNPGFTAACLGTMAVGIGATALVFAVLHAVVLKPLAYREPDRLYIIHEVIPQFADRIPLLPANAGHFDAWRKTDVLEELAAVRFVADDVTSAGSEPERVGSAKVTANFFSLLGITPQLGRTFNASEDQPGRDDAAVISDGLWRRRFGGDAAALGRTVHLGGRPFTIVGVLPSSFRFPSQRQLNVVTDSTPAPDIFRPMAFTESEIATPGDYSYSVVARLRPGWTPERTRDALDATQAALATRPGSGARELHVSLAPMRTFLVRDVRDGLWLLMGAVAMVLLIICVNLANLLLARNARRRQEFAIRAALGAGRARLLRQLAIESLLLAVIGGSLGLFVAWLGLGAALHAVPVDLPRGQEVELNAPVIVFAIAVSVVAGLTFGLLPALRLRATQPSAALKSGGRTTSDGPAAARARRALVSAQVALCTMLLVTCGLLLASFSRVMAVDRGFAVDRRASVEMTLSRTRYPKGADQAAFFDRLLPRLAAAPGVAGAALVSVAPLRGTDKGSVITLPGDVRPIFDRPFAAYMRVSPAYFETMGIALLQGRAFEERDRTRRVAIVSEKTARQLWPGANPIGKRFREDESRPFAEVIGIVADVRTLSLEGDPGLMVYQPYWQESSSRSTIVVRTNLDPEAIGPALRAAVREIDREMPIPRVMTMQAIVSESVANRRFQLSVVTLFALCAVALASIGIFGVISHLVAQRTSEIGLRMALGAQASDLRRLVLGQGLRPVFVGLAIGAAGALAAGRALRSLLFGVSPTDPAIVFGAVALLMTCAVAACYLPAQRATRIDPLKALRAE